MTDKTMTLDDVLEQSGVMLGAGELPTADQLVEWREVMAHHLSQPAVRGEAAWNSIVEQCMVTEAVTPDESDPYGTISQLIDYHIANTAPPPAAGVPNQRDLHVLKAAFDEPQFDPEDFTSVDTRLYFWRTGWNACCQTMLSATPSPTIDVGAVAWAWKSDGMTGWALGHVKPTPENTHQFHERNTVVRPLVFGDAK